MPNKQQTWSIYRLNGLGEAVEQALQELSLEFEELNECIEEMMDIYDEEFNDHVDEIKAHVHIKSESVVAYRETVGIWTFWLKNVTLRERSNNVIKIDSVKLIAVGDARKNLRRSSYFSSKGKKKRKCKQKKKLQRAEVEKLRELKKIKIEHQED